MAPATIATATRNSRVRKVSLSISRLSPSPALRLQPHHVVERARLAVLRPQPGAAVGAFARGLCDRGHGVARAHRLGVGSDALERREQAVGEAALLARVGIDHRRLEAEAAGLEAVVAV